MPETPPADVTEDDRDILPPLPADAAGVPDALKALLRFIEDRERLASLYKHWIVKPMSFYEKVTYLESSYYQRVYDPAWEYACKLAVIEPRLDAPPAYEREDLPYGFRDLELWCAEAIRAVEAGKGAEGDGRPEGGKAVVPPKAAKTMKRRRRPVPSATTPPTPKHLEAVHIVGERKGNLAEAALARMAPEPGAANRDGAQENGKNQNPPNTPAPYGLRDKVFISYSHKDKAWLKLLKDHLKPYHRQSELSVWEDSRIKPGDKWREEIKEAIAAAKVAVLLVSRSFLASEFIATHELPRLLNAAEEKLLTLMWIPVSHSSFSVTGLEGRHAACDPAKPLRGLSVAKRDEALVDICKKIKAAMGWA